MSSLVIEIVWQIFSYVRKYVGRLRSNGTFAVRFALKTMALVASR